MSSVLADGKESRLYYRLVKELAIAKDVTSYQRSGQLGSLYVIQATAAKGHTTDELVAEIDKVLAEVVGAKIPTDEELRATRASYEVGYWDAIETIGSKADLLNNYNMFTGDPGFLAKDLQRYHDATPASVVAATRDVVSKPRVVLHIWPEADRPAEKPPEAALPAPEPSKKDKKRKKKAGAGAGGAG